MAKYSKLIANIRIAELSGLANRMAAYYDEQDLTAYPDYSPFVDSFKELTVQLSDSWNSDKLVSELADLDAARDEAFRTIFYMLQGYTFSPVETIKSSGDALMAIFQKYGMGTISMSYDGESGNIDSFLTDLEDPSVEIHIIQLANIALAISNLKTAQSEFAAKQNEYNVKNSIRKETSSAASTIKPELLEVLNGKIISYHNVLAELKDDAFREIAAAIDDMIVEENELTKLRKKQGEEE